jgi:predicted ArsR family transcriptional regulator
MSLQLDIFGAMAPLCEPPRARRSDPATSHAAAESAKEMADRHHQIILQCLREHGRCGKDAIASRTRLTGVAVARRMAELVRAGKVRDIGAKATSTAGRAETAWEAC